VLDAKGGENEREKNSLRGRSRENAKRGSQEEKEIIKKEEEDLKMKIF
jgi:hypothetical protein